MCDHHNLFAGYTAAAATVRTTVTTFHNFINCIPEPRIYWLHPSRLRMVNVALFTYLRKDINILLQLPP